MVKEALRGYVSLAGGFTELTAARARAAARSLVEQGEATAGQVSALAEDLLATSRRNRESMVLLVRHEIEQAVRHLGVGASSDVETLTTRVRELERTVRELRAQTARPAATKTPATKTSGPSKAAATKAAANKTGAKKPGAKEPGANETGAKKPVAKKTAAKKSANTKAAAAKPPASAARKSAR